MMCMSVHSSSASSFCSTRETIAERISSFARQEIIPSIMRTSKACKRILPVSVKRLTLFYHLPFLTPRSSFATAMQSFSSSTLSHHLKSIAQNRNEDAFLLLDGGTGEELFRRKVPDERMIWSATAVLKSEYHEVLEQVHASFLQAGAQAITTNSYGIVPGVGFDDAEERGKWIRLAGKIARKAVEKHKSSSPAYVLGSLGPLVESYRADLIRPHDQGVNEYGVACQALQPHCDAFLAETMSCWEESRQALEAVSLLPRDQRLPVMVSYTLDSKGNTRDGKPVTDCVQNLLDYIIEQNLDLLSISFNCCEPEAITLALARIAGDSQLSKRIQKSSVLLGAYANRLTAVDPNWTMAESEEAQPFRTDLDEGHYWNDFVRLWTDDMNVKMVGGCCGMTPEHIGYIHNQRKNIRR